MMNKAKEQASNAAEKMDSGLDQVKSISGSTVNAVGDSALNLKNSSVGKIKELSTSADKLYAEKVKSFIKENAETVKASLLENKMFANVMKDGLTIATAVPVMAFIIYNLLPGPIQFIVDEEDFVDFIEGNILFLNNVLDLKIIDA